MLRFGHIELHVRDAAAARHFYEHVLGFEVEDVQGGGRFVWLGLGDRAFLLREMADASGGSAQRPDFGASPGNLVLYTDDLPGARAALEARGLVFEGDDGPGCPTFRDPDGHWWQLVDPRHG